MCGFFYFGGVLFLFSLIVWSGLVENILNNFCLAYLVPFIDLFRKKNNKSCIGSRRYKAQPSVELTYFCNFQWRCSGA